MRDNSRIRFNPVTKDIEVEGTEQFVKTYFDKLQAIITGATEKKTKETKGAPTKATKPAEKKAQGKRVTNISAVVQLIQNSPKGISTAELKKKTKLSEHQIWSIVYHAVKAGKIRKMKRGAYASA